MDSNSIVTRAGRNLDAISEADVVVLATPVRTILKQIPEVAKRMRPGAILTDTGSTKTPILKAMRSRGRKFTAIAGHPLAGHEQSGLDACDPDLFVDRPWILLPSGMRKKVRPLERLLRGIGAKPTWMGDAGAHDLALARISHLPHLLAYGLSELPGKDLPLAGPSFRDATRVALSDVEMVLDFLMTNPGPLARSVRELEARIRELSRRIKKGDAAGLRRMMLAARRKRSRL